jgi:hypothetical protein
LTEGTVTAIKSYRPETEEKRGQDRRKPTVPRTNLMLPGTSSARDVGIWNC